MAITPSTSQVDRRLDAVATRQALSYPALLTALAQAAQQLDDGMIRCPERLVVPMPGGGVLLSMPAVGHDIAAHKLVTVTPENAARGLPTIHGHVAVVDARSGKPLLFLDGPTVTGRRTAAISMLAIQALRPDRPAAVLLIGTGVQAQHHVEALAELHAEAHVVVRGSSPASARAFCERNVAVHPRLTPDDGGSRHSVGVVITCTTSRVPVYAEPVAVRRLVVATGAFRADAAEIAQHIVLASALYVDDPHGARTEAGDLIMAGVDWSAVGSLAQALRHPPAAGPVLFKSVGCAAWDLAAARVALGSFNG